MLDFWIRMLIPLALGTSLPSSQWKETFQNELALVENKLLTPYGLSLQRSLDIQVLPKKDLKIYDGYTQYSNFNQVEIYLPENFFSENRSDLTRLQVFSHEYFHALAYTYRFPIPMHESEGLALLAQSIVSGTGHPAEDLSMKNAELGLFYVPKNENEMMIQYGHWSIFYRTWFKLCGSKNTLSISNALKSGVASTLTEKEGPCSSLNEFFKEFSIRKYLHSWNRNLELNFTYPKVHTSRIAELPSYSARAYYKIKLCDAQDLELGRDQCLQIRYE